MKKQELQVGKIYNFKWYKKLTRPVRVVSLGKYHVEIEYLDKQLQVIPVPNPRVWGALTEGVTYAQIDSEYVEEVK